MLYCCYLWSFHFCTWFLHSMSQLWCSWSEKGCSVLWFLSFTHDVIRFDKGHSSSEIEASRFSLVDISVAMVIFLQDMVTIYQTGGPMGHFLSRLYPSTWVSLGIALGVNETSSWPRQGGNSYRESDGHWQEYSLICRASSDRQHQVIKTVGGLTRGRGFKESTSLIWLLSLPACGELHKAMQDVTGLSGSYE